MSTSARNLQRLRPLLERLTAAVSADDGPEFEHVLDDLVHARRKELFAELRRLTSRVRSALESFQLDARFATLTQTEIPNARQRLQHVLKLTDDAAHQTLDLIERSAPLVNVLAGPKELQTPVVRAAAGTLRDNLSNMLLAQGYQDLTGQIVRGVITLVSELETALSDLARLAGDVPPPPASRGTTNVNGHGPVVPGVDHGAAVHDQHDVDALLLGLGL